MEHIITEKGSVARVSYGLNGVEYRIIGSKSTGFKAIQTLDTVKNTVTGKRKEIKREVLYNATRKQK